MERKYTGAQRLALLRRRFEAWKLEGDGDHHDPDYNAFRLLLADAAAFPKFVAELRAYGASPKKSGPHRRGNYVAQTLRYRQKGNGFSFVARDRLEGSRAAKAPWDPAKAHKAPRRRSGGRTVPRFYPYSY